jgi:hypothetical protein
MQKPVPMDLACKLIISPLLVTVLLDILGFLTTNRSARRWFCVYFAMAVMTMLLFLFVPTALGSVSALRLAITVIQVLIETYVWVLLFSAPVSACLAKQGQ